MHRVVGSALAALPKVPDGFKIRLVAAVPAVQYPCQVATAPDGSLFVAEDPMDQVGPANKPIDRILLFREGKEPVVFADKLNAIFGMVWHDGALYVMNMPHLTVLRDTDGDGKADERKELFTDLGVPAGSPNGFNDHIVSGPPDRHRRISLYLGRRQGRAQGDRPRRPDVQVVGGGTLRCRLDGTGLEVFSTGTRNHLEPNLDDRDNLFTYDNTDDGLGWWTRVTHHIDGGYYGYPYDYHNRTDRILPRMAEYGGGSPCGGVFYSEDAWPEKYRGRLFWAEWGKRSVQAFRFVPEGATFKVADVIELVEPGEVDDFRPLDLALSHDGRTLYIADWWLGGWGNKTEKLGRVYAVTYAGRAHVKTRPRGKDSDPIEAQIRQLDHPSYQRADPGADGADRRGKPALAAVADRPGEPDDRPGRQAAPGLGRSTGSPAARPRRAIRLIDALKSTDADVRAQAARAWASGPCRSPTSPWSGCSRIASRRSGSRRSSRWAGSAKPRRSPRCCRSSRTPTRSSPSRPARHCGGSTIGRRLPRGSTRPSPRSAPALLAMEQVYESRPSSRLGRVCLHADPSGRRAGQGARIPGRGPSQGRRLGRQVVGHPAGQAQTARQDDRLGRHAIASVATIRELIADPLPPLRIAADRGPGRDQPG